MGRLKLLMALAVSLGLTLGVAGMASAASISCGQCHGTLDNGTNAGTSNTTDRRGISEPAYEKSYIPTQDNGVRGLHGIHSNYSSTTYGAGAAQTVNGITARVRGNCNYCHNGHPRHATGFVGFTQTAAISTVATQPLAGNKYLMSYTSAGRGVSYKGNISSMDMNPTGNCTTACHKGTTQTNPAPWGNYTATSIKIKLNCSSCHMDGSNINTISTTDGVTIIGNIAGYTLSSPPHVATSYDAAKLKGHATHLNGDWQGTKMIFGTYSGTLQGGPSGHSPDYACQLCHTNNTDEGGRPSIRNADGTLTIATTDFASYDQATGTKMFKAYPHATDGTNVVATNATVGGLAGINLNDPIHPYNSTTAANGKFGCTNNCHANFNLTTYGINVAGKGTLTWDDTGASHCDSCHNHTASSAVNNASNVKLTYGHSLHFDAISTFHVGSGTRGLPSCNDCHLGAHTNYAGTATITKLPVTPGTAGLLSTLGYSAAGTISTSGTCMNNNCHSLVTNTWDSIPTGSTTSITGCATCHSYPGAGEVATNLTKVGQGDWTATSNNGHSIRFMTQSRKVNVATFGSYTTVGGVPTYNSNINVTHLNSASTYNYQTDTYASVTGDQTKCGKCHTGGTHMNGKKDVNAGTGAAAGFTLTTSFIGGQGHVAQCQNASCHFRRTTPNWY